MSTLLAARQKKHKERENKFWKAPVNVKAEVEKWEEAKAQSSKFEFEFKRRRTSAIDDEGQHKRQGGDAQSSCEGNA